MKYDNFFKVVLLAALIVLIINIAAAITVAVKLVVFSKQAIMVGPFVLSVFIAIVAVNSALILLVLVYLIFRKA